MLYHTLVFDLSLYIMKLNKVHKSCNLPSRWFKPGSSSSLAPSSEDRSVNTYTVYTASQSLQHARLAVVINQF